MLKTSSVSPHIFGVEFHISWYLLLPRHLSYPPKIRKRKADSVVSVVNKQVVLLDEEELTQSYTGYFLWETLAQTNDDNNEEDFV